MGRYNYANWKKLAPMVEERDNFGMVQAWTHEYYKCLMEELEREYDVLIHTPNVNAISYAQGKLSVLESILFEEGKE